MKVGCTRCKGEESREGVYYSKGRGDGRRSQNLHDVVIDMLQVVEKSMNV